MKECMVCDKPFRIEYEKFVEQPYRVNGQIAIPDTIHDQASDITPVRLMRTAADLTSWEARPEDVEMLAEAMASEWNLPYDADRLRPYVTMYALSLLQYQ